MKIQQIRSQFPKLCSSNDIHLDGPGGTQVPQKVIDSITNYLIHSNANLGAPFQTSRESDLTLLNARNLFQCFFNAPTNQGIIFGNNMTTLTFHLSRCMSHLLNPNQRLLVTSLDHEANISPWQLLARDQKCAIDMAPIDPGSCSLDFPALEQMLTLKPRIVAITGASNAVGTINPIKKITEIAHRHGALVYLDAVHLAPHRLIDVADWKCDFVACSAYKFFGPHIGVVCANPDALALLNPYKVRPAPDDNPHKWMTGTQNHEGIAGAAQAVSYLISLSAKDESSPPRERLAAAYAIIENHETTLSQRFLEKIWDNKAYKILGYHEPKADPGKVSTFSIQCLKSTPKEVATYLASKNIFAYCGNFYAKSLMESLKLEDSGGALRIGFVHYNTLEEVDKTVQALNQISRL